jgi:transcriptional regulator with XRE-family HTH domain
MVSPLAEAIKEARAARNWSRETLAREAGVTLSTVNRIETKADARPTVSTLYALAVALDIEPGDLVLLDQVAS